MAPVEAPRQHGRKGAYVGGDWMDIEDCGEGFSIDHGSDKTCHKFQKGNPKCATCPRSRSRYVQAKEDGSYDVIVIGSGCIGSSIARELSKSNVSVLMLEAADDVTQGATKGNSGIVHAGFDDKPGTNRAKYCWPGNQMFADLDNELHFGYQKNGSLVIAKNAEEEEHLKELKKRGEINGVKRLKIIKKKELFELEPYANPEAVAALLSPDAGNLIPYEYAIAMAENAVDNGVELRIRRCVTEIKSSAKGFTVTADHWEPKIYANQMNDAEKVVATNANAVDEAMAKQGSKLGKALMMGSVALIGSLKSVALVAPEVAKAAGGSHSLEDVTLYLQILSLVLATLYVVLASGVAAGSGPAKNTSDPVGAGGSKVSIEEMKLGGSGSKTAMEGVTVGKETYRATYIVNAAGSYSDKIANMIGDNSFKIKPRLGDYILLNRNQGHLAKHTLFPCPGPLGKGVLVQTTLWGNLILGPTARDVHLPEVMSESIEDIQKFILSKCKDLVPSFDPKEVIHAFCGARAKSDRGDWIIEPSEANPNFIHAAGIDSPGLAGSPAIALEIVRLLEEAGLALTPNPQFNPNRAPIIGIKNEWKNAAGKLMRTGPVGKITDPSINIVCKCERVVEEEIVTALHRSLPIDSTQALRKRTRAGMGHCQAEKDNYNCECRAADIISRENESKSAAAVGRRPWPATSSLAKRWIDDEDKEKFVELFENK